MKLYSISLKNLKNSISNYTMYFISIVFCVFIFFSFKSIQYNSAMDSVSEKINIGVNSGSVVIAIFVFLFIYYSNSFFVNRRLREIGTYNLLGMRKSKIGFIFLLETIIMGLVAILIGVLFGFVFSKLMTMILLKLMNQMVVVKLSFSFTAFLQTLAVFLSIFIVIGIRNVLFIRNKKLIELFYKSPEKVSESKFVALKGILGIVLIVTAYVMATGSFIEKYFTNVFYILIPILPGTFLFFSSAVTLIINIVRKNKKFYYKGRNLVAYSELKYKVMKNSRILATIAILIATSATVFGLTASLYYAKSANIEENFKFSFVTNASKESVDTKIDKILKEHEKTNPVLFDKKIELLDYDGEYKVTQKRDGTVTDDKGEVSLIKQSDFKSIIKHQGSEYKEIEKNNGAVIISSKITSTIFENSKGNTLTLKSLNEKLDTKYEYKIEDEIFDTKVNINTSHNMIVVKDSAYDMLMKNGSVRKIRLIDVDNQEKSQELSKDIEKVIKSNFNSDYPFDFSAFVYYYDDMNDATGITLFIGLFLAVVFMLCTGSIIFLKQLSDIYDDKGRYIKLKKLGASDKDISNILSKQLKIVFILPLAVGTVHNLFAMTIGQKLVSVSIVPPVLFTLLLYFIVYFVYYVMTLKYAKKLILE